MGDDHETGNARAGDDPAGTGRRLHLFEGYDVEIEYMIVDAETLDVRPISDTFLRDARGDIVSELERGPIAWCNELVLHLVELKTNGPAAALAPLPGAFQRDVVELNRLLEPHGARLMPTGMHPWMDPDVETRRWPHEYGEVYGAFHRIFDCDGHGWANLQAVQLNLPFADDDEFARLHAAIRLLLPIMPALTASSPLLGGAVTGALDQRLLVYRDNCRSVPSVSGAIVPDDVESRAQYESEVLGTIYRDLAPFDEKGLLRHEWVNARGAIARFDRHAIEIRVLDAQECPRADLAVLAAITAVTRALVAGQLADLGTQRAIATAELATILWDVAARAGDAVLDQPAYLRALGRRAPCTVTEAWRALLAEVWPAASAEAAPWREPLATILDHGCLARRITRALDGTFDGAPDGAPDRDAVRAVYRQLCDCLAEGRMFTGG